MAPTQRRNLIIDELRASPAYEAPRVEFVLIAEELEREVMVAIVASPD